MLIYYYILQKVWYNKRMDILFNKQKLGALLKDLSVLIKTPVSIFDSKFNYVASNMGISLSAYCEKVRSKPELFKKCLDSDICGFEKCKATCAGYTYLCHAFLNETVEPIVYENEIIGYLIIGQYRKGDEREKVVSFANENSFDSDEMLKKYDELTCLTEDQIVSVRNILKSCVLSYYLSEAITFSKSSLIEKIIDYVDDNIAEKLTADGVAETFYINKKQLYSLFNKALNKTFHKYVDEKRMALAVSLLKNTELRVVDVAEKCGYGDYNHFIQTFKKHTGITPLKFRRTL